MSAASEREKTAAAVRELGALPMPVGPGPLKPVPVTLTEVQVDALAAAGNRVVNDEMHEHLCMCDAWPESCVSTGDYFMGAWDVSGLEAALPAVLGLWEQMRGSELAALRARVASLESDLVGSATRVGELLDANRKLTADLAAAHVAVGAMRPDYQAALELRKRVAELEAEQQIVYRVVDCAKTVALYTSPDQARRHCESMARAEHGGGSEQQFFWRLDEDTADQPHGPEWLIESTAPGYSRMTGFSIDPVVLAKKFAESGGV